MYPTDKIVFPLVSGEINQADKSVKIFRINGTAFSIGQGFFLTAGHVLKELLEHKFYGILKLNGTGGAELFEIEDYELIKEFDLVILYIPKFILEDIYHLTWNGNYSEMFTDVFTIGFPYGYEPDRKEIRTRGYKGYIISATRIDEFKGVFYELSFSCPRGISGAPIIDDENKSLMGIIVGNKSTEIEVYRETEILDNGKQKNSYLKYEAIEYGIALDITSVVKYKSKLLGKTIGAFLKEMNKIAMTRKSEMDE